MRYLLLLCFIAISPFNIYAQENKPWAGFGIEGNLIAGHAFKHSSKFKAGFPTISPAFDLNFIQQTYGRKDWQQRRRYPIVGFGITYTRYDDSVYGDAISIYPNLQIPLITGKKLEWTLRAGFGLAYITKRFSRASDWDTLNTVIGSHVNNYSFFSTDLRYRVNEHLDIQLGADFAHISNAAFRTPNLGINKYGGHVGVRYFPVTSKPMFVKKDLPKLDNRILGELRLGLAGNETGPANGPKYPIYMATAYASKRYWGKNKLMLGLDYSFHTNVYRFLINNEIEPGKEKAHSWQSALFLGNEFLIGRAGVIFQVGYYVKHHEMNSKPMYQKLGGCYYLLQHEKGSLKELFIAILLKTHTTEAELVELGIGAGF
ncbi:MAG: acyloxyacyl hydrolase [Bacteroidetes bacterium]|nr:acyloxyacyl hydrolase [Bacteroidota bacterium]